MSGGTDSPDRARNFFARFFRGEAEEHCQIEGRDRHENRSRGVEERCVKDLGHRQNPHIGTGQESVDSANEAHKSQANTGVIARSVSRPALQLQDAGSRRNEHVREQEPLHDRTLAHEMNEHSHGIGSHFLASNECKGIHVLQVADEEGDGGGDEGVARAPDIVWRL